MKVKKISEEVTYKQITTAYTFEVNDKTIQAYHHIKVDNLMDEYDVEVGIEETDKEKLTDLELEMIEENLDELMGLKDGGTEEIDEL